MNRYWFRHKSFGFGAGLPISWEGWIVLALFIAAVAGVGVVSRLYFIGGQAALVHLGGVALLLVPLVLIVRARTEGGWRWRDGEE